MYINTSIKTPKDNLTKVSFLCATWLDKFVKPVDTRAADTACIEWAENIGFVTRDEKYYEKFSHVKFASLSACFIPDVTLDKSLLNTYLQMLFFTFDDIMDNLNDFERNKPYSPEAIKSVIEEFCNHFRGKFTEPDDWHASSGSAVVNNDFPKFRHLCTVIATIRQIAMASNLNIDNFVEAMVEYFRAVAWESTSKLHEELPSMEMYLFRRDLTIGYYGTIEAINLIRGIVLPEAVRQDHLYKFYMTLVCRHVILVNDLMSLHKEISNGEIDNSVLIMADRTDLNTAIRNVNAWVNRLMHEIKSIAAQLLVKYEIKSFIESTLDMCDGHLIWYGYSDRYGKICWNMASKL